MKNGKNGKIKNFKRFQYFNFETDFLENENLFQKTGAPLKHNLSLVNARTEVSFLI